MNSIAVNFSLSANIPNAKFILISSLTGSTTPMTYDGPGPDGQTHLYSSALRVSDIPSFPLAIDYRYARDGIECFPECGQFVITRPSPTPVSIFDSLSRGQYTDHTTFSVAFHIPATFEAGCLPVLSIQDHPDRIPMIHDPGKNTYHVTHKFSIYTVQPLLYHYALTAARDGHLVHSEPSRPHTLFVRAPVGGFLISVFESWSDSFPSFSHVSRPIETFFRPTATVFAIEAIPPQSASACFFKRKDVPQPEPLAHEGVWFLTQELPRGHLKFESSLGWRINSELSWSSCPFDFSAPASGAILYRDLRESPLRRGLSVFLPLISLRLTPSRAVGDFSVIPGLARWAKSIGIAVIHLHVEQLENSLLDPVHADIGHPETNGFLNEVRDAKLAALWALFCESKERVQPFVAAFEVRQPWLRAAAGSEFGLWVQWFLASQLTAAFEAVAETGVQLLLDVVAFSHEHIQRSAMWFGHFAQALRIVGLEQAAFEPIPMETVTRQMSNWAQPITQLFCRTDGSVVQIKGENAAPEKVAQLIGKFSTGVRGVVRDHVNWMFGVSRAQLTQALRSVAVYCPAAIVLSGPVGQLFPLEMMAEQFHCLPESNRVVQNLHGNQVLSPSYLSPEVASEFPEQVQVAQIREEITRKNATDAMVVDVFFGDLMAVACGDRVRVTPIQLIKDHCRFLFPFTLDELTENSEVRNSLLEVLNVGKRWAQN
jgi:hypothetical protein